MMTDQIGTQVLAQVQTQASCGMGPTQRSIDASQLALDACVDDTIFWTHQLHPAPTLPNNVDDMDSKLYSHDEDYCISYVYNSV